MFGYLKENFQTGSAITQSRIKWVLGVLFQWEFGRGVNSTALFHVVHRLKIMELYFSSFYWLHGAGTDLFAVYPPMVVG